MSARSIIVMLAIAIAAALVPGAAAAQPPPFNQRPDTFTLGRPHLRKSITELNAAELASLRRGFAQMIAWNNAPRTSANFRRSLVFWANMHSFFGQHCADPDNPDSGLSIPGMAGVAPWAPADADELSLWCKCEHGSYQFLLWHRMYLYYFERVLRAAARDPTLTLPYWDYNADRHLPSAYRARFWRPRALRRTLNPLRVESRLAALNDGSDTLDSMLVDTGDAMAQSRYSGELTALGFNSAIEFSVHGNVHCALAVEGCPTGLMGSVSAAGLDPIFYSHHANIDRYYECWLQQNLAGRLPAVASELDRQFSFVDGNGSIVRRRVRDMLTAAELDYRYSRGGGCPAVALRSPFPDGLPDRPVRSYVLRGETPLDRGVTTVPLRIAPDLRAALRETAADRRAPAQATLVIDGLAFDRSPRVLYKVFLRDGGGRRVPIGVLNFFAAGGPHANHGAAAGRPARVRLNATAALARLGAGEASLVFEPTTGVTGSTPALAARRIDPRTNLRFRAAAIEIAR